MTIYCNGVVFEEVGAIVFDKDGTLANSQNFLVHLAEKRADCMDTQVPGLKGEVLKVLGVEDAHMDLAGLMAVGTREENESAIATLITQTGRSENEARSIVRTAFLQADQLLPRKADLTPPFPGITELLQACRSCRSGQSQSLKLAILSSDTEENVRDFVDRYQLTDYFQLFMGARSGLTKPDPRLLKVACEALDVPPRKTLVIGDAIADIQLAYLGGAIGAIGVTWGGVTPDQLIEATVIPSEACVAIAHQVSDIQLASLA